MAPISKPISLLFLTTLLLSIHVNARDSQFFSKVTPVNHNLKETQVPNNEGPENKPEQQPVFIPENENSYGLYGHETGLHPPTTTTTTTTTNAAPYSTANYESYKTTSTQEDTSKYSNNNYYKTYNKDAYSTNQDEVRTRLAGTSYNNNFNNFNKKKDAFGGNQNELSDTKYTEEGYNSMENQNNNNKYYYNNNNAANGKYFYNNNNNNAANSRYYKTDAVNNNYNGERQGISDTRFMEGGKYYYDVNSDKYHHSALYGGSSRGVNSENWYKNKGYFGNNNVNSYENKNSMEGYQNQEVFEDEQEDFEP